jgi:hypothetical protein
MRYHAAMRPLITATMLLLSGPGLDGWFPLAGRWANVDQTLVCQQAPASIRSAFESDQFELRFRYRHAGKGTNRIFIHSKMSAGGIELALTPSGLIRPDATRGDSVPDNAWIDVRIDAQEHALRATSSGAWGRVLSESTVPLDIGSRGFIRFQATEPGLEIRDLAVAESGFTPLFAPNSLDGWEIVRPGDPDDPGWVIDGDVVRCRPRRSGWLRTWRTFDDFILRLEYQLPPGGNSGIYVRAPIEGRVSRLGFEIQLLDDLAYIGEWSPAQYTGSIYDGIAPEIRVPAPPNQWNAVEILCDGDRVRTTLNSVQLYDARLDDTGKDTNSHKRPLATRRTVGFLGFQDHAAEVKFRRVRLRELP